MANEGEREGENYECLVRRKKGHASITVKKVRNNPSDTPYTFLYRERTFTRSLASTLGRRNIQKFWKNKKWNLLLFREEWSHIFQASHLAPCPSLLLSASFCHVFLVVGVDGGWAFAMSVTYLELGHDLFCIKDNIVILALLNSAGGCCKRRSEEKHS